jgi:hypothetical protein
MNLLIELYVPLNFRLDSLLHDVNLDPKAVGLGLKLCQLMPLLLDQDIFLNYLLPSGNITLERLGLLRVKSLILLVLLLILELAALIL